ncbi:hypothetical protein Bbelb_192930 [Branchiostoma belcheri]|nr:hypothetical protein Bbelb_192930 [Branchiostoma belcheri]
MATRGFLQYTAGFFRSLKAAKPPMDTQLKDHLRHLGLLQLKSRPRGCRAGKNVKRPIPTIVGHRTSEMPSHLVPFICKFKNLPFVNKESNIDNLITLPVSLEHSYRPSVLRKIGLTDTQPRTKPMPTTAVCNARSLCNKLDDLQTVLSLNKVQIAVISETWFSPDLPSDLWNIDGYQLFSKPRVGKQGGGVAVYVADDVQARELDIPVPPELECLWVKVRPTRLPRGVSAIAVCAVYFPPASQHGTTLIDHLIDSTDRLRERSPDIGICVAGDFNRLDIQQVCKGNNLRQVVNIPTRKEATLDLVITNVDHLYETPDSLPPIGHSDHNVIVLKPKTNAEINKTVTRTVRPFPDSKTRSFGQWITTYDWEEVLNAPDTQSKTDAFYDKVHSKLEEHFPTKTIKMHCNDKPWLTPEIKNLVQQRQKAFANKQDNTWRGLRNKIQRKINKAKKRFYKTKIQALRKDNPAQWYRGIKTMLNTRAKELILQVDGVHPENPKAIADAINDVLSQVTRSLPPLDLERLPAFLPAMPPPVITPRDMYEKLRRIKVRKAPGPDGLPSRIIKEFAYELSLPMSDIVNSSLLEAHVPMQWREANIVPLPKTCPPDIDELRPVSLTPILAKVAESIICSWVLKDIAPNIDQYQFGCLKGKSTTHCLVDIVHQLAKTSDQPGSISTLVLTDFAKAYDRVDHTIAVSSILTLGLRPSLTNWLISFLTNRRHRVRYSNTFSDWRNTTCGLPQGTVLGPIIFLALINSAAENAVSMRWKFVDDLNLLECRKVREPPAIQQDLDELSKWSTEQNMKLHPKKCKVMYLNFSKSVPQLPSLKIDNYPLVQVKVAKLLGLHIQSDLKWNTQVDHMVKKGNQRLFFLRRLKTFGVTSDDLVTVYTSFVRPTCEYAVPVWQPGITQTQRLQLERIQRRAFRTILGAHYTSYTDACHTLGLTTLHQRREHLCETFAKKLLQSTCFREWLPPCRGEISGRKTRNSSHLDTLNVYAGLVVASASALRESVCEWCLPVVSEENTATWTRACPDMVPGAATPDIGNTPSHQPQGRLTDAEAQTQTETNYKNT